MPQVFQHDSVLYVVPATPAVTTVVVADGLGQLSVGIRMCAALLVTTPGGRRTAVRLARAASQRRNEVSEKALFTLEEWARRDSNPGPPPCHGGALTN